jgi:AraC family transcriptional regulator
LPPAPDNRPSSNSEILWETLPGGPAAMTHLGQYDKLTDAYGAIEQWIESEGLIAAGAPWKSYVNDPAQCADPQDWNRSLLAGSRLAGTSDTGLVSNEVKCSNSVK